MNYGSGNQYDAYGTSGATQGGGGFIESSNTQAFDMSSTPNAASRKTSTREHQSLIPLTIHQLLSAASSSSSTSQDDAFQCDGRELNNVKIIGMIMNVTPQSTHMNFTVNDGTGQIDVRFFIHGDEAEYIDQQFGRLREGVYVTVVGSLRSFQNNVNLACFHAEPIQDFNQLTYHFLECIQVHLEHLKGPIMKHNGHASAATTTPMKQQHGMMMMGNNHLKTPTQQFNSMGFNTNQGGGGGAFMDQGMMVDGNVTQEQSIVLGALRGCTSDTGIHVEELIGGLNGKMQAGQIRDALTYLVNEGHVYSTIDEDHYKLTE